MTQILFGVGLISLPASTPPETTGRGDDPASEARLAEDLGFDFVSAADHPGSESPSFENWTLLTWVAASTSRIKVLSRVLGVPFRSPPMLAKMAESLDRLSAGRLLLGLGAGYAPAEVDAFGPAGISAGTLTGLQEAIGIVRGLWTQAQVSYSGKVYTVGEAAISPRPQRPIPIWLGTFGDRGLAMTGRLADGWIPSLGYMPEDELPVMRDKVLTAAAAAGRRRGEITCALNLRAGIAAQVDPDPEVVIGPAGYVADRLAGFVGLGFTAFNLMPAKPAPLAQLEQLARQVLPQVRELAAA